MTIPASFVANSTPSVLNAGGSSLVMNGLFLTENPQMPNNTVLNFANAAAVAQFFGPASAEALAAPTYFAGFSKSTIKPGAMLFAAYNSAASSAFLQSASLAGLTLAALQGIAPGTMTLTVDGTAETSASINLSAATSFSNAATLIEAGFTTPAFSVAWNPVAAAFVFTTTLTGATATISYATGTLATALSLTQATGAFLSQGAVADTPSGAMNRIAGITQNWSTMVTLFEPNLVDKQAFAVWFSSQDDQYLWSGWDSDPNASVQGNTTCFGALATLAQYDGVTMVSGDPALALATGTTVAALALNAAIFVAGAIASVNFSATNGRTNLAFLVSTVIQPTCADLQIAKNLLANGYNFYGSFASRNQGFIFLYNGKIFGQWTSIVRYVNQIWLNSQFELELITLLLNIGSLSYDAAGYNNVRATLAGPIANAITFGAIRTGVVLSDAQITELNQQAGLAVDSLVTTQGYYLQILDPGATVRQAGGTPIINFWYTDGGDVLQLNMASINII